MKRMIGTLVLFILLILTVFAITSLDSPKPAKNVGAITGNSSNVN